MGELCPRCRRKPAGPPSDYGSSGQVAKETQRSRLQPKDATPNQSLQVNVKIPAILCAALTFSLFVAPVVSLEEEGTDAMLHKESLGGLRINLPEKDVLRLLDQPAKRGKLVFQAADGNYVQEWHYPEKGIDLSMSGEKKTGPKRIVSITASAPCTLATRKGIKIGSAENAVRKAYGMFVDRNAPAEPGTYVLGSIYGGIIFNFEKGKVSRIFFGAAAE